VEGGAGGRRGSEWKAGRALRAEGVGVGGGGGAEWGVGEMGEVGVG
jgi:hypothetical protein